MHDDDLMDRLLRDAMATEAPRLSPAFDARVLRRLRPRRLTPLGRGLLAAYALVAVATAVWFLRSLPVELIALAVVVSASLAVGAGAYARRLALDH